MKHRYFICYEWTSSDRSSHRSNGIVDRDEKIFTIESFCDLNADIMLQVPEATQMIVNNFIYLGEVYP